MIHASMLLKAIPNLPPNARETLSKLATTFGDPELHLPGLPSLPNFPTEIPQPIKDAIVAALGRFEFTFWQSFGLRVSIDGQPLGGIGGKLSETFGVKNPAPKLTITPVFELGSPKDSVP